MDLESYDKIMLAVYRAATVHSGWADLIGLLGQMCPEVCSHVFGHDTRTSELVALACQNYDPDYVTSYVTHFGSINPSVAALARAPVGVTIETGKLLNFESIRGTEFYGDWLRPQGNLIGGGIVSLFNAPDRFIAIGGHIAERYRERVEGEWVKLLRMLTPHLTQAFDISRSISLLRSAALSGTAADTALWIVSWGQRVIYQNDRADALSPLFASFGVDRSGRLRGPPSIEALFTRLRATFGSAPCAPLTTSILSDDGDSYRLRIAPHRADPILPEMAVEKGKPRIDLLVTLEKEIVETHPAERIRRAFGLSHGEAMAAHALASGQSAMDYAETRGVSIHTVRNQIKYAMIKMGVHRQTDMAVLVSRLLASDGAG